jgi:hypothetical protein
VFGIHRVFEILKSVSALFIDSNPISGMFFLSILTVLQKQEENNLPLFRPLGLIELSNLSVLI